MYIKFSEILKKLNKKNKNIKQQLYKATLITLFFDVNT